MPVGRVWRSPCASPAPPATVTVAIRSHANWYHKYSVMLVLPFVHVAVDRAHGANRLRSIWVKQLRDPGKQSTPGKPSTRDTEYEADTWIETAVRDGADAGDGSGVGATTADSGAAASGCPIQCQQMPDVAAR